MKPVVFKVWQVLGTRWGPMERSNGRELSLTPARDRDSAHALGWSSVLGSKARS
jgi:hypothetical protein